MEPYFKTKLGSLYCGDCLDVMTTMPTGSIDLILTDPPYGINENNKQNLTRCGGSGILAGWAFPKDYGDYDWDKKPIDKKYFDEMRRVSKNQIIFGGNYYGAILGNTSCYIVWDKDNTGDFADCELAWTSFKTAIRKIKWRWNGCLQEDMKNKEERQYPTQKPLPVMQWIINKYSKPDDIILDPFIGSGTTAVACEITNHKWIGIDKEKKACEIAKKRIIRETRQLTIT